MSRKISLLCILAGAFLASAIIPVGCALDKDPYALVDPFEEDATDSTVNNNDFARASVVALASNSANFDAVLTLGDVDVYSLGPVVAGDIVTVDLDIPDRVLLNAAVAIFDSVGRMFYLSGETTLIANSKLTDATFPAFTPKFDFAVRQTTDPLYLAIASLPEPDGVSSGGFIGRTGGPYTVHVNIRRGNGQAPPTTRQVVALHFDDTLVDYPPVSSFGQLQDFPQLQFAGLSGRVLDPAWWRPFLTIEAMIINYQNNAQFWNNFVAFVGAVAGGAGGQAPTPAQVINTLLGELQMAMQQATANPAAFTPNNVQWFQANGYTWLYNFAMYLGPGLGQTAGLNIWGTALPSAYPTIQDPKYDDLTVLSEAIRAKLRDSYRGLNIEFLVVGKDPIPTDVPVSTLYFVSNSTGGTGLLGLASAIDMDNPDHSDFAVIWGGEIGYFNALALAVGDPNSLINQNEIMAYVGNTGAHELGHILGLVHTNQAGDIMNAYADFRADLTATFGGAPLHSMMFPIGRQDSYLLLLLELGMSADVN